MTESPRDDDTVEARGAESVVTSLLVSDEFRWIYRGLMVFLFAVALGSLAVGGQRFVLWRLNPPEGDLGSAVMWGGAGALIFLFAGTLRQLRRYARGLTSIRVGAVQVDLGRLAEEDFEGYERARRLREEKARHDFDVNLRSTVRVQRLEGRGLKLFPRAEWDIQPGVNVLLGRNGYGKSLLFRAIVGALQRDDDATAPLLSSHSTPDESQLVLSVSRDGVSLVIRRNSVRFAESIGKVPVLAIPDSRLFDRSQSTLGPGDSETIDLRVSGADHFLRQRPYWDVIQGLLYEICLDFWEHHQSLERPVFEFLSNCVRELTGYEFRFHSIARRGRTGFQILVETEGNPEPMPIQYASQGTLSVLAMFGLIRSYLRSLANGADDEEALLTPAIVVIDEADAHLHPAWQQKVPSLLRQFFPMTQFIVSAHSPLFVAGCWRGEVAVLRRADGTPSEHGFRIDQLDRDFVGASSTELYNQIFEIEELDDTYLEYATKASLRPKLSGRINELSVQREVKRLSDDEETELRDLSEESRRIQRATDVMRQRSVDDKDLRIAELESELARMTPPEKEEVDQAPV